MREQVQSQERKIQESRAGHIWESGLRLDLSGGFQDRNTNAVWRLNKRKSEVVVESLTKNSIIQEKDSDLTPRVSEDKNNWIESGEIEKVGTQWEQDSGVGKGGPGVSVQDYKLVPLCSLHWGIEEENLKLAASGDGKRKQLE